MGLLRPLIFFTFLTISGFNGVEANLNTASIKQKKSLLVTGCGRSGTGFMATFLNASGYHVGHEKMGERGTVSWLTAANVKKAPWGPLWKDFKFKKVFHQVRNPIKVIQSMYNVPPRAGWDWIGSVIKQINPDDSQLTKCVKYWIYWNRMVEIKADWTYRIEDIDLIYPLMAKKLNWWFTPETLKSIPKNTNTKGPPTKVLSWDYLKNNIDPELYLILEEQAIRYGYNPD